MQNLGYRAFLILPSKVVYNICRNAAQHAAHEAASLERPVSRKLWTAQKKWCKIRKERGFAMFGFLTVGTTLTMLDLALKNEIESQKDETFPRDLEGTKGMIRLHKNHNQGFSFGVLEGSRAVELIPLCMTSGLAGAWVFLMGTKGRILEKLAVTLSLAGGLSNTIRWMTGGYAVDSLSV